MNKQIKYLFTIIGLLIAPVIMAQESRGPIGPQPDTEGTLSWTLSELKEALPADEQAELIKNLKESGVDYDDVADVGITINTETLEINIIAQPRKHTVQHLVSVGVQVGIYMPITYEALYMLRIKNGRPLVDGKIFWQPTKLHEQVKGIAVDIHPFRSPFYIGTQAQMIDFLPVNDPWYERKYDRVYGQSATMGLRGVLGKSGVWQYLVGTIEVGSTWIISRKYDLEWQPRLSLQLGLNLLLTPNKQLKSLMTNFGQKVSGLIYSRKQTSEQSVPSDLAPSLLP